MTYITVAEYLARHGTHKSTIDHHTHYGPQAHCETCKEKP